MAAKNPLLHAAIFLTSLATLVYEIALMRLFSVTLWYYFAFFVISLALLGGGAAAAALFVRRGWVRARLAGLLPGLALAHGLSCALSPAIYLVARLSVHDPTTATLNLALILGLFFLPFLFGGAVIAALLAYFPERVGSLYWADLSGAGIACLVIVPLLHVVPAPELLAWTGLLPAAAGLLLARALGTGLRARSIAAAAVPLATLLVLSLTPLSPYAVRFSKTRPLDAGIEHVEWTPLARLSVYRSVFWAQRSRQPFGWGMSPRFGGGDLDQRWIEQDECAGTPLMRFDGNLARLDFLGFDVTNFAYRYRPFRRVLVVGAGGGRDILSAKHFGAEHVTAVEINPGMRHIVDGVFGDFSGRPYGLAGVEPVIAEARSFLARERRRWDLIQISLIDSWAASTAGAFALAENNLYTAEAFGTYLDRLAPGGVLTVSRWYAPDFLTETLRLVNLTAEALSRRGIRDPGAHVVVVAGGRIATVLVSPQPFSAADVASIRRAVQLLAFRPVYLPTIGATDERIGRLLTTRDRAAYVAGLPVDLSPSTDDRPFFFLPARSVLSSPPRRLPAGLNYAERPLRSLRLLFFLLGGAALAFVLLPLALVRGSALGRLVRSYPDGWLYFAAIGVGFMLVEISLIQRYVLFLGHPTYATSVVLFALLVFAGLGSAVTPRLVGRLGLRRATAGSLAFVCVLVLVQTYLVPILLGRALGAPLGVRVILAGLLLSPLGFAMGTALPLGVARLRDRGGEDLIPYAWGINAVTSVFASVLATIVAISAGYSTGLLAGLGAYAVAAALATARTGRKVELIRS